jgi:hypothetical protein
LCERQCLYTFEIKLILFSHFVLYTRANPHQSVPNRNKLNLRQVALSLKPVTTIFGSLFGQQHIEHAVRFVACSNT